VTAALPVKHEADFAKRLTHSAPTQPATWSCGDLNQFNAIVWNRFATLAQNIFMESDGFTNIRQGLFTILALADAAGRLGTSATT